MVYKEKKFQMKSSRSPRSHSPLAMTPFRFLSVEVSKVPRGALPTNIAAAVDRPLGNALTWGSSGNPLWQL